MSWLCVWQWQTEIRDELVVCLAVARRDTRWDGCVCLAVARRDKR